ncbi:hypothetical protein G5I_11532 [Acromyrmex echinatior]|uniref:Uncharacterized protein n=1 Tax=Acromyrmex echinatior TaxID=103372 RepID=F4WZS4_ACREC|nr:hypothetical protein G5I_11532 [Acromyrmex echinatior]
MKSRRAVRRVRLVERIESKKERRKVCTRENEGRGKDGTTTRVGEMGKAVRSYQERPNNAPGQSVGRDRQEDPEKNCTRGEDKREERRQRDEEQRAELNYDNMATIFLSQSYGMYDLHSDEWSGINRVDGNALAETFVKQWWRAGTSRLGYNHGGRCAHRERLSEIELCTKDTEMV